MRWRVSVPDYSWALEDEGRLYAGVYMPREGVFEIDVWDYGGHVFETVAKVDNLEAAKALAQIMVQLRRSEYDAVQ